MQAPRTTRGPGHALRPDKPGPGTLGHSSVSLNIDRVSTGVTAGSRVLVFTCGTGTTGGLRHPGSWHCLPGGFLLPRGNKRSPLRPGARVGGGAAWHHLLPLQGGSRKRAVPGSLRLTIHTFGLTALFLKTALSLQKSLRDADGRRQFTCQSPFSWWDVQNSTHRMETLSTSQSCPSQRTTWPPAPPTYRPNLPTGFASAACPHARTVGILEQLVRPCSGRC